MAIRRLVRLGAVVVALLVAAPLSAQIDREYVWSPDRPDGVAPVATFADRTYEEGELSLSYRFQAMALDGTKVGSATVPLTQVLDMFFIAPTRQEMSMHLVGAAYGVHDRVTLEVAVPFLVYKRMEQVTEDGEVFSNESGLWADDDRAGFGDVSAVGHLAVYDDGPYRAHLTAGASLPLGSFYQKGVTPVSAGQEQRLPYPLQIGSGTVDPVLGFTIVAMNGQSSTGIQGRSTLRFYNNDLNYRLGHRFEGSVWGAYHFNDFVSASARIFVHRNMNVQGADPELNPNINPASNPELQGGVAVTLPLGLNVYFPEGFLEGNRFGIEAAIPVHESLDGPQLKPAWQVTFGWEYALSMLGPDEGEGM